MKENLKINTLSDSIKILNDSMSNLEASVSWIKKNTIKFPKIEYYGNSTSSEVKTPEQIIKDFTRNFPLEAKKIIDTKFEDFKNELDTRIDPKVEEVSEKYIDEIKKERNNIIWSLSLFVAFFTFISTNITIFSKVDDVFFALILMCGMIISIAIMLMIFFLFLHYEKNGEIFKSDLFKILRWLIILLLLFLLTFYIIKTPLSPSLDNKVNDINEKNNKIEIKLDNEIKLLKYENNLLKEKLEKQISKEVEFQLLKQQPKNTSN